MRLLRSLLATFVPLDGIDIEESAMWIGTPVARSVALPGPREGIVVARVTKVLDGNRAVADLGGGKELVAEAAGSGMRVGLLTACDPTAKRLLSRAEVGLAIESYGLVVYPEGTAPGTPCASLHRSDHLYEIEVTANRGDLLSHLGFARELAARTGRALREAETTFAEGANASAKVRIEDAACGRYQGRRIEGVRVGPSPVRLADAVEALGARALSGPVDVTNFVLFELGQPLHVFDADRLEGGEVIVRRARKGERLRALDGVDRVCDPDDLVIADGRSPVALAGVMGGADSAVGEKTSRILLEAARFDPRVVRRSARRHRLSTESSYRFERSVDLEGVDRAARRATRLLLDTCGGSAGPATDLAPGRSDPARVVFRPREIARALGIEAAGGCEIDDSECGRLLGAVGFRVEKSHVVVPPWRADVSREADLVEEIARLHGYDRIPETLPPLAHLPEAFDAEAMDAPRLRHALRARLRAYAAGRGYAECVTFSLEDPKTLCAAGWNEPVPALAKPLAENLSVLRPEIVPSLVRVAGTNAARGAPGGGLFEIGRAFAPGESERVSFLAWGEIAPAGWWGPARPAAASDLLADVSAILSALGVALDPTDFDAEGRAPLAASGQVLGRLLALDESRTKPLGLERHGSAPFRCVAAEISVEALLRALPVEPARLAPPPRFPSSSRDLAFLFPKATLAGPLLAQARRAAGANLASLVLFDAYRGDRIDAEKISYGFRLVFRAPDRSLSSEEVDSAVRRVAEILTARGGAIRERA